MSEYKYNRIKVILSEKDIEPKELQAHFGVARSTVANWINNDAQPSVERMHDIAAFLKVDFFELFYNPPVRKRIADR